MHVVSLHECYNEMSTTSISPLLSASVTRQLNLLKELPIGTASTFTALASPQVTKMCTTILSTAAISWELGLNLFSSISCRSNSA